LSPTMMLQRARMAFWRLPAAACSTRVGATDK